MRGYWNQFDKDVCNKTVKEYKPIILNKLPDKNEELRRKMSKIPDKLNDSFNLTQPTKN